MLDTKAFIGWASRHVVVLFAHNELGHEPLPDGTAEGTTGSPCPLYPGLSCRDHLNVAVDIDSGMRGLLPTVPFIELCPNSWLVLPSGSVLPISEEDQFVAARIQKRVEEAQKSLGPALDPKQGAQATRLLAEASAATEADDWPAALKALASLADVVGEPAPPLAALVAERMQALDEPVTWAFEEIRDDADRGDAARRAAVEALRASVDVPVYGKRLSAAGAMAAWLGTR